MFLLHKKRRARRQKNVNPYYIVSALCLITGMILGYLNANSGTSYLLPSSSEPKYIFKFSMLKNTILLLIMFVNSFSMLGFPLNAATLVVYGYIITSSITTLFLSSKFDKLNFIISNFPKTVLIISALFLLSEAVFSYSHCIFANILKSNLRNNLNTETKKLFTRFSISFVLAVLSAYCEAFLM